MKYVSLFVESVVAIILLVILAIYRLVFYVVGLFIQPIAILFAKEDKSNQAPFTQYPEHGMWYMRTAPKWLFPFGNERDGFFGDKRGWWANERDGKEETFLSQYIWSALRNPCNNMRFMPLSSCNAKESKIKLLAGQEFVKDKVGHEGWQFVRAIDKNNIPYYGFYLVKANKKNPTTAMLIRIGFKVEPRHVTEYQDTPDEEYGKHFKGMTFRFSLNKDIS